MAPLLLRHCWASVATYNNTAFVFLYLTEQSLLEILFEESLTLMNSLGCDLFGVAPGYGLFFVYKVGCVWVIHVGERIPTHAVVVDHHDLLYKVPLVVPSVLAIAPHLQG